MAQHEVEALFRYLHILSGITWIGLLYFFNLVNAPAIKVNIKDGDPSQKAGPHLTLRTLWWFRWGAMFTLIFGLLLLDQVVQRSGIGFGDYLMDTAAGKMISFGMLLGVIMWFNVWFIIWPIQRAAQDNNIRIAAGGLGDDEVKKLQASNAENLPKAVLASRFNFWASIPMLFFMVFAGHAPGVLGF